MKTLKIILIILGLGIIVIAIAGMYKFNYLANQPGYDIDGNLENPVEDMNSDNTISENSDDVMTVKIADSELGGDFVFEEYQVEQTLGVLDATLEKLFEVRSNDDGRYGQSLSLQRGTPSVPQGHGRPAALPFGPGRVFQ